MNYYIENNYKNSETVGTNKILDMVNLSCTVVTVNKNTIA